MTIPSQRAHILHEGKTVEEWAAETGYSKTTIRKRIKRGLPLTKKTGPRVIEGKTVAEWTKELGCTPGLVNYRFRKGKSMTAPKQEPRSLKIWGYTKTIPEWSKMYGVSIKLIHERLSRGWSPARAVKTPTIKQKDLTGHRYGTLLVIERLDGRHYLCRCDCGWEGRVSRYRLHDNRRCQICANKRGALGVRGAAKALGAMAEYRASKKWGIPFWKFIETYGRKPGPDWIFTKEDPDGPEDWTNLGWIKRPNRHRSS